MKRPFDSRILIIKDGIIHDQFSKLAPTLNLAREGLGMDSPQVLEFLGNGFDYVHLNTIESSHVLPVLTANKNILPGTFVVSHVHELEGTIQKYGPGRIQPVAERADRIICVSDPVRDNLVHMHGFPEAKTVVIPPCARASGESGQGTLPNWDLIQRDKEIVLGCGELTVGKGVDVFIRTAQELDKLAPGEFQFCWLGADTHLVRSYFETDLERLGLKGKVVFLGFSEHPDSYFKICDVFFMCSRQDSFPLVCLEAASLKKPIVYFPEAGGIKTLLGSDGGFPVRYLDDREAARTIHDIVSNQNMALKRTQQAYDRWHSLYRPEAVLERVAQALREDIYASMG